MKSDPDERGNLSILPGMASKLAEMQAALSRLMKETGLTPENDKMPLDEGIKKELPDAKIR